MAQRKFRNRVLLTSKLTSKRLGDIAKTKHPYTGKVGGYYKVDYEDGWNYPIAIYRFKYVCRGV